MIRHGREWFIHHANHAARESTNLAERNKHAKILFDIYRAGFDEGERPYRSASEFLDIAQMGKAETRETLMARRAINYITFTRPEFSRTVYIGRHTDSDPGFILGQLTSAQGDAALRVPALSGDPSHRALVLDGQFVDVIDAANEDTLVRANGMALLQGRFDHRLFGSPELFALDPDSPTHIFVGRKAIVEWTQKSSETDADVTAEFAAQVQAALSDESAV